MDNIADADGDSEGYHPNEEMSLMIEIDDMLYSLGVEGHGSHARASVDPNYVRGGFEMGEEAHEEEEDQEEKYDAGLMESINKIKTEFKRYL
jgi:hypothetical protein